MDSRISFSSRKSLVGLTIALLFLLVICEATIASPEKAPLDEDFLSFIRQPKAQILSSLVTDTGRKLGHIPSPVDLSHVTSSRQMIEPVTIPASYDLRDEGRLTSVKDQGDCGACWAFATYGSLESWLLTNGLGWWNFSENNLTECNLYSWAPCEGGNSFISTAYLARRSGPVSESNDPYIDLDTGCTPDIPAEKYVRKVLMPPEGEDGLKLDIMDYGAIQSSMYWKDSYYNSSDYTYYYNGTETTNHDILLIGWDDDKYVPGAGYGAWIARNSWGTSFGDNGYFYISYYDSNVGTENAIFVNADNPDDTMVYQHDPLGWTDNWGYSQESGWGANEFTARTDGTLQSVSTYTAEGNTSYEIYIKDSLNGTTLRSKTGTLSYPGYHTIDLDYPLSLYEGETFVVAIKYTTPGYDYPIPAECRKNNYTDNATASPGESYISANGSSWTDLTTKQGGTNCNVNIKAFISPTSSSTYTSFSLTSGWNIISSPGFPINPDPQTALGDDISPVTLFYNYYPPVGYTCYTTDVPAIQLRWDRGYWINADQDTWVDMNNYVPTGEIEMDFYETGWHLIGFPYPVDWSQVSFSSNAVFETDGAGRVRLVSWDPGESLYYNHYTDDTGYVLAPYYGYWVKVKSTPASLTVSKTTTSPSSLHQKSPLPKSVRRENLDYPPRPKSSSYSEEENVKPYVYPNPASTGSEVTFTLPIDGIEKMALSVTNTAGKPVYDSGYQVGKEILWDLTDKSGNDVPNGIYLYRLSLITSGGKTISSEVGKLWVLK